jgi:polar amino acid transport system substrate-binding protein
VNLFVFFLMACLVSNNSYARTIKLVTDPWCPFACSAEADRPGYMIEIANEIFNPKKIAIEYKTLPFARAVLDVENGLAEGLVGEQKIPARKKFKFPSEEQGQARACFYVDVNSTWRFKDLSTLKGKVAGIIDSYTYGAEMDQVLVNSGAKIEKSYGEQALENNISKLISQRVDVIIEYEQVMNYYLSTHSKTRIRNAGCDTKSYKIYIAFSPEGKHSFGDAEILSQGMKTLRKNGKLKTILRRYGLSDWKSQR